MSVNSEFKAQRVTEDDHRTVSYISILADSIFAPGYRATVLVHPSYFDTDEYLATLIVQSITSQPKVIDAGLHEGKTREEALLGLLYQLEKTAVQKSENDMMNHWEEWFKLKIAKQERQSQAARAVTTAERNDRANVVEYRDQPNAQIKGKGTKLWDQNNRAVHE